jgi:lipid II:glycine glycyltransferase (peptidoglycan interpeptide bridge formation enzyme)
MFERVALDDNWNTVIAALPGAHLLQTREWAQVKSRVGWEASPLVWRDAFGKVNAAALLLTRSARLTRFGPTISICYIPRGPMLDWRNRDLDLSVLHDLQQMAGEQKALFLKIDPEMPLGTGVPGTVSAFDNADGLAVLESMKNFGWRFSASQVQFRNTVLLDLNGSEDDWLQRMKQKTRYNVRLAQRSGVTVRVANESEYPELYRMYAETSVRDGFMIRPQDYYMDVWHTFRQAGMVSPLVAEVEGQRVAGLVLFHFGRTAWYLYGMSTGLHRDKMPNYLLQWEAMRLARSQGCLVYDLWGAPDEFDGSDAMAGVFRFKEGLGGTVLRTCGAWDYVLSPSGYALYENILPKIQNVLRRSRKEQTKQEATL